MKRVSLLAFFLLALGLPAYAHAVGEVNFFENLPAEGFGICFFCGYLLAFLAFNLSEISREKEGKNFKISPIWNILYADYLFEKSVITFLYFLLNGALTGISLYAIFVVMIIVGFINGFLILLPTSVIHLSVRMLFEFFISIHKIANNPKIDSK